MLYCGERTERTKQTEQLLLYYYYYYYYYRTDRTVIIIIIIIISITVVMMVMTVMIVMAVMIVMSDCGTAHSRSDQIFSIKSPAGGPPPQTSKTPRNIPQKRPQTTATNPQNKGNMPHISDAPWPRCAIATHRVALRVYRYRCSARLAMPHCPLRCEAICYLALFHATSCYLTRAPCHSTH